MGEIADVLVGTGDNVVVGFVREAGLEAGVADEAHARSVKVRQATLTSSQSLFESTMHLQSNLP